MSPLRMVALALVAGALAPSAFAQEPLSVRISLSREDPTLHVGRHEGTGPVAFYVFTDGARNRGGEFGLRVEGGECLGFIIDPEAPWIPLPMIRPYPGTIAQVTAGEDCHEAPLCLGQLLVTPSREGGRVLVDVIPSERASEVTILGCDYGATSWFVAYPAVVNGDEDSPAEPHMVSRPSDPLQLLPEDVVPDRGADAVE